jgi:class 3 adenylate cyclase
VREQPTGTVTFLFTDVVDHTGLWEEFPGEMPSSLERHDEILRGVIERQGGYVFSTAGDAFCAAFAGVEAATAAAIEAQQALRSEQWHARCELRVRMGLHTGEAQERDGDYFGPAVIRSARRVSTFSGQISW